MLDIEARLHKEMKQEMYNAMRELLGPGYVPEYYIQAIDAFVCIAEFYGRKLADDARNRAFKEAEQMGEVNLFARNRAGGE